jgi:uncharacterized protein involved in exopolysaccharide biosynthesis
MAEINLASGNSDEFDIRNFLRNIFKRWKIILILTIIGAVIGGVFFFTGSEAYTATTTVFMNSATTPYTITPLYLAQSEEVKTLVLESTGLDESALPEMGFTVEKTDKNIVTISATSQSQNLAVKVVNAWADAVVSFTQEADSLLSTEVEQSRTRLEELDNELSAFLSSSGLQELSWVEMIAITGGTDTSNIAILESSRPLPIVPLSKRNEIKKFVREINIAQWEYFDISKQAIAKQYVINQNAFVLNHAQRAEIESSLFDKLAIPLGAVLGFFLAFLYILLANWWKAE